MAAHGWLWPGRSVTMLRRGLAAHRQCRGGLHGLAPALASLHGGGMVAAPAAHRPGRRAGADERLLLSGYRPPAAGHCGAIEYLGTLLLAAYGTRTRRNALALGLAVLGVGLLTDVRLGGQPLGFVLAFGNGALFMLYVLLGHRIASDGGQAGIERLGAAMVVALVAVTPLGIVGAVPAFMHPPLLLAGIGVGICSSVVPYVCDQLAMARLPRATFALLLALLPASAAVMGFLVLRQVPRPAEIAGVALVVCGVAVHQEADGG